MRGGVVKVVLFCGGQGTRIREFANAIPKPMVPIGSRPLIWHVMKYYAHHGHTDFILCLGHRGNVIRDYFLEHAQCDSGKSAAVEMGGEPASIGSDISDWTVNCVETGELSNVGQRLRAVQPLLQGESMFLANYSDGLTDLPLPDYLEHLRQRDKIGSFLAVPTCQSFHVVTVEGDLARQIQPAAQSGLLINGGFFAFKQEIFEFLQEGDELVEQPFERLIRNEQLIAFRHPGFWACMDTFKDREQLEMLCARGTAPWEVWKTAGGNRSLRRDGPNVPPDA